MKVEGGGVATSCSGAPAALHKIKIKEEAKDCCAPTSLLQQSSSTSGSSPPPRGTIGAIATITISSGCGAGELAATPTGSSDAFPVDLDLKSRAKAASRDKIPPREPDANGTESRDSSSPSPSSSPSSHYQQPLKLTSQQQPQQQQQQLGRTTSSSSVRSPDSDEQGPPLQSLKTEVDDTAPQASHRQDETKCNETNGGGNNGKCISGIFAAHGKLKRLLGTLVQFAMDISPDTGDTVRTLVLGLLSGSMSAEEFHSALQEATNFPLRGFVLPYLKHTLPSLQRDLSATARADNQTCAQYLRSNESAVLEAVGLTATTTGGAESAEGLFGTEHPIPAVAHHYSLARPNPAGPVTTNAGMHAQQTAVPAHIGYGTSHAAKRKASEALYYENGGAFEDGPPYKRWSHHPQQQQQQQHHHTNHLGHPGHPHQQHPADVAYCWYAHPLHPTSAHHPASLIPNAATSYGPSLAQAAHLPHQPAVASHAASAAPGSTAAQNGSASLDDEWKNIHVMLNCILGMVEKTKRALAILQKRGCTSPAAATASLQAPVANGAQLTNGGQQQLDNAGTDGTFKRLSGEIIRATEDRVAEVKRRAEEAVQEVKRAAVAEVQRAVAVAVAESRANERLRSQRYLDGLQPMNQQQQRVPIHPVPSQQHSRPSPFLRLPVVTERTAGTPNTGPTATSSTGIADDDKDAHLASGINASCWNCGRPALETCSGCGVARYCSSFCQHRDWEAGGHHASCSQQQSQHHERARSSTPSPPSAVSSEPDVTKATVTPVTAVAVSSSARPTK